MTNTRKEQKKFLPFVGATQLSGRWVWVCSVSTARMLTNKHTLTQTQTNLKRRTQNYKHKQRLGEIPPLCGEATQWSDFSGSGCTQWEVLACSQTNTHKHARTHTHTHKHEHTQTESHTMTNTNTDREKFLPFVDWRHNEVGTGSGCTQWAVLACSQTNTYTHTHTHTHAHTRTHPHTHKQKVTQWQIQKRSEDIPPLCGGNTMKLALVTWVGVLSVH